MARAYVDAEVDAVVQIQTNSRDGYPPSFLNQDPLITSIEIRDGERITHLSSEGGMVYYNNTGGVIGQTSTLSYRLFLSEQIAVGDHNWPLQLNAMLD